MEAGPLKRPQHPRGWGGTAHPVLPPLHLAAHLSLPSGSGGTLLSGCLLPLTLGAHPLLGMARLMLDGRPHIVSKKELVLAGHVHSRDAAKDTQHPDPGGTEYGWHLAVGRGQGTLTCGCAAVPLPRAGRESRVEFPHQKGKLRHSAAHLLLGARPRQAAPHKTHLRAE